MSFIIVESPTKRKTLSAILGPSYQIIATMGHIMDLPKNQFGVDIKNNFTPRYKIIPARYKTVRFLRAIADVAYRNNKDIFLATDPDREGEAIAFFVSQILNSQFKDIPLKRITFNEITKRCVLEAIKHPREIDYKLVDAQKARRIIDRIVGYQLSPLLRQKIRSKDTQSAGRVQSVALRLMVEREKQIDEFVPEEFWEIMGTFSKKHQQQSSFTCKLKEVDINNKEEAKKIENQLRQQRWWVSKLEEKQKNEPAPSPFNTSLLQQTSYKLLGLPAEKTMRIAQRLYEGVHLGEHGYVGLITYIRTDSFRVSPDAIMDVREFIKTKFGEKYLPEKPNYFASPKSAQEAHEAIRPCMLTYTPESVKNYLPPEFYKLYKLIFDRFIASQMTPARYLVKEIEIQNVPPGEALTPDKTCFVFATAARKLLFDGYKKILAEAVDKEKRGRAPWSQELPHLEIGEEVILLDIKSVQNFTSPPPRYSQASLIKTLEKLGIGRPSTYAQIISTLKSRKYIVETKFGSARCLLPTQMGKMVIEKLCSYFENIMDYEFTSQLEDDLDMIERGEKQHIDILNRFYSVFNKELEYAKQNMPAEIFDKMLGRIFCASCHSPLVQKNKHLICVKCKQKFKA